LHTWGVSVGTRGGHSRAHKDYKKEQQQRVEGNHVPWKDMLEVKALSSTVDPGGKGPVLPHILQSPVTGEGWMPDFPCPSSLQ
jgi:hypothetical protein